MQQKAFLVQLGLIQNLLARFRLRRHSGFLKVLGADDNLHLCGVSVTISVANSIVFNITSFIDLALRTDGSQKTLILGLFYFNLENK